MLAFTLLALSSSLGLLPGVSGFGLHQTSTGMASCSRKLTRFRPRKLKAHHLPHDDSFALHEALDHGDTIHSFMKYKEKEDVPEVHRVEHLLRNPSVVAATAATAKNGVSSIADLLKAANNGPAPAITSVAVIDSKQDLKPDMLKQLGDIQLLSSFVNAYAANRVYDARNGKAFNLDNSDDALDFIVQFANNINLVMTNSMSGYLTLAKASTSVVNKSTTGASVDADVVKALFGSLSLPAVALKELTGLLRTVTGKLDASISTSKQNLKHVIMYYYFEPVEGLPDVKVAKMRFYYISISQKSWEAKVCGQASFKKFNFDMTQVDTDTEMNFELVEKDRDQLVKLIETLTEMNIDDVNAAISPKVITKS